MTKIVPVASCHLFSQLFHLLLPLFYRFLIGAEGGYVCRRLGTLTACANSSPQWSVSTLPDTVAFPLSCQSKQTEYNRLYGRSEVINYDLTIQISVV